MKIHQASKLVLVNAIFKQQSILGMVILYVFSTLYIIGGREKKRGCKITCPLINFILLSKSSCLHQQPLVPVGSENYLLMNGAYLFTNYFLTLSCLA